jgi:MFS family permease
VAVTGGGPAISAARRRGALAVVTACVLFFSASQSSLIGASAALLRDLGATPAQYAWALSGNLVAAALVTPLAGRFGDMVGQRRVLALSVAVAVVGGIAGAVLPGIGAVIVARVLSGAAGGILPLGLGITRSLSQSRVAAVATTVSVGGGMGPVVGGVLTDAGTYRSLFAATAAALALSGVGILLLVPRTPPGAPSRPDVVGLLLLCPTVVLPLLLLSRGTAWGWTSPAVLGCLVAAAAAVVLFVRVERRTAAPLIQLDALRNRTVLLNSAATFALGAVSYAVLVMGIQLAQAPASVGGLDAGATEAGLWLLPGGLAAVLSAVLAARLPGLSPGTVLAAGGLLAGGGMAVFALTGGTVTYVVGSVLALAGVGITYAPMSTLAAGSAPAGRSGEALGINTLVRLVGSATGAQAVVLVTAPGPTGPGGFGGAALGFAFVSGFVVIVGCALARRRPSGETRSSER